MHPAMRSNGGTGQCRKGIAVTVVLIVALAHVARIGTRLDGTARTLYSSFFSDLAIPFAMYFLLCIVESPMLSAQHWQRRGLLVFGAASLAEVAQAFGIHLLGRTFDPFDILMFGVGVSLAVALDRVVLHLLPCWRPIERPD